MHTTTHGDAGLRVAEDTIRHLLRSVHLPVSRLVAIAREELAAAPEALAEWEIADLQGEAAKPLIEHRSGPALTTEALAARRRVSGETIRKMAGRGELIHYPALRGKGWRFPLWQFHGTETAPWVGQVIQAYGHNGWGLVDFLTVPRENHNGHAYLTLLQTGEAGVRDVLAAARRSNPD